MVFCSSVSEMSAVPGKMSIPLDGRLTAYTEVFRIAWRDQMAPFGFVRLTAASTGRHMTFAAGNYCSEGKPLRGNYLFFRLRLDDAYLQTRRTRWSLP